MMTNRVVSVVRALSAVVLTMFLAGSASVYAQEVEADLGKFHAGVRLGSATSFIESDDVWERKPMTSFTGGLFLNYRISNIFSVQPEVNYVVKGGTGVDGLTRTNAAADYELNFIDVPLLLKINTEGAPGPMADVFFGPFVSFLYKDYSNFTQGSFDRALIKDNLGNRDYGVTAGMGFDYYIGKQLVSIDARYSFGMSNLAKVPGRDYANHALMVTAAFAFGR